MCGTKIRRINSANEWAWQFPEDLGIRGWVADVQLWLVCRNHSLSAARYGRVMATHSDPIHLAAFAGALNAADEAQLSILFEQLCRCLKTGAHWGDVIGKARKKAVDGVRPVDADRIRTVISALVRHRAFRAAKNASALLCAWIVRRMPNAYGMHLLGALRILGSRSATLHLQRVISDAEHFGDEVRRIALMQTLPPIHERLLDFDHLEGAEQAPISQEVTS
jgi:hypothetical protein